MIPLYATRQHNPESGTTANLPRIPRNCPQQCRNGPVAGVQFRYPCQTNRVRGRPGKANARLRDANGPAPMAYAALRRELSGGGPPARAVLLDFGDAQDVGFAVHVLAHFPAEGLEMIRAAMRVDRGLIGIALHEDVEQRIFRPVQCVELAARLVGVHGGDELLRHGLELFLLAFLDLDLRDDAKHRFSPAVSGGYRTIGQPAAVATVRPSPPTQAPPPPLPCAATRSRSEERRVGKEGASTCRSRWT